jgi:hypothetical protein
MISIQFPKTAAPMSALDTEEAANGDISRKSIRIQVRIVKKQTVSRYKTSRIDLPFCGPLERGSH